jgi:hypothetical protein
MIPTWGAMNSNGRKPTLEVSALLFLPLKRRMSFDRALLGLNRRRGMLGERET